jgi:hypothetical protein
MAERRVTWAVVRRIAEGLSDRDRAIVDDVARVRVLSGRQVERLHFTDLIGQHRDRTRRRALERLTALQLLTTLQRRIGGVRAGSAGQVFALGPAGQRLRALEAATELNGRAREPGTPTERFLAHNLVIAELYVSLREAADRGELTLTDFRAEPACWWRSSEGEWIRPDAVVVVGRGDIEDVWAIEVDQATESLPTLRRKLMVYLNLAASGEPGPRNGPLPRVLVSVPHERRLHDVRALVSNLPGPAEQLIATALHDRTVSSMYEVLKE